MQRRLWMRENWRRLYRQERSIRRHLRASVSPSDMAAFTMALLRPGGPRRRRV